MTNMADPKPAGMMSELVKHAFTTAIGVVVTFYVTSAMKEDDFKQDEIEKGKQITESLEKTNKLLSNYISRYDSLHERYIQLRETRSTATNNNRNTYKATNHISPELQPIDASSLIGNSDWVTADGTILWQFSKDKVFMSGIGSFKGFVEAAGRYDISGDNLQGTATYSKLLYLPSNEHVKFDFKLDAEGKVLYGNITDNLGNVTVATLYRNSQ
jgi:hypothetical protein